MLNRIVLAATAALVSLASVPAIYASDNYVYVESNIAAANANSIYAFHRQADGTLHQLAGSPFLSGGAGVQDTSLKVGPSDSDQDLITNDDHTLLFAVNSGSDTIAVFHIGANGGLKPIDGSPFPSGGTNPVSLALRNGILFVVNKNGDFPRVSPSVPNYTTMRVLSDGVLVQNSASYATATVANGSSPSQVYLVPNAPLLFGTDFLGGLLQRMLFDGEGQLLPLPPQPLPSSEFDATTPRLPLGLWSHPSRPLLYVGFVTDARLGVYDYSQIAELRFIRSVPNSGAAICWLRTNKAGTRLYTSDTTSNSVSVYDLGDPETPVEIQNQVLSGLGNVLQFGLSGDEKYLYALSSRGTATIPEGQGNILHVLKIEADGTVSEAGTTPVVFALPAGTRPQGVLTVDLP